jgi:hypothetical protein
MQEFLIKLLILLYFLFIRRTMLNIYYNPKSHV